MTDEELAKIIEQGAIERSSGPLRDVLWAAVRALRPTPEYRIALRPDERGDLDDVVVTDVSMFRMENMDGRWWLCCYLAGSDERICWWTTRKTGMVTTESPSEDVFVFEHNVRRSS